MRFYCAGCLLALATEYLDLGVNRRKGQGEDMLEKGSCEAR